MEEKKTPTYESVQNSLQNSKTVLKRHQLNANIYYKTDEITDFPINMKDSLLG